jgi:hypothetical protein
LRGQSLELDDKKTGETNLFLQKMKTKKQLQEENQGVEQDVINLGFVQNLAQK